MIQSPASPSYRTTTTNPQNHQSTNARRHRQILSGNPWPWTRSAPHTVGGILLMGGVAASRGHGLGKFCRQHTRTRAGTEGQCRVAEANRIIKVHRNHLRTRVSQEQDWMEEISQVEAQSKDGGHPCQLPYPIYFLKEVWLGPLTVYSGWTGSWTVAK